MHGECADMSCDPMLIPGEHGCSRCSPTSRRSRDRTTNADEPESGLLRSPREHLLAWLRSLDADAEGLPAAFTDQLRRALAHYGVESLDRTPELEAACYRLFLSHERAATARPAVLAILDRRLQLAGTPAGRAGDDFREALDRLAPRWKAATRSSRTSPARSGSAASTSRSSKRPERASTARWSATSMRWPPIPAARTATSGSRRSSPALDRWRRCSPHRMSTAEPVLRRALLETLARRFYRVRTLDAFTEETTGRSAVLDQPVPPRRAAPASRHGLSSSWPICRPRRGRSRAGRPRSRRATSRWPTSTRRATATPTSSRSGCARRCPASDAACHRPSHRGRRHPARARPGHVGDHAVHVPARARRARRGQDVLRGMHPMMAHRLRLSRLAGFASSGWRRRRTSTCSTASRAPTRRTSGSSPSPRCAISRRCAARAGGSARCPSSSACSARLEGIRRFQAHRKPSRRLQWNRVLLHVWPMIELTPEEIRVAGRPAVDGDRGPGRRDAARPGPAARGGRTRARAALHLAHRARRHRRGRRSPDAAAATARRERAADDLGPSPRAAASGRDRQAAGARAQRRGPRRPARRAVRRARPRRGRTARAGRPAAGDQPGGRGRGR